MSQIAHQLNASLSCGVIDEQKNIGPTVTNKLKKNSNEANKNGKLNDIKDKSNVNNNKKKNNDTDNTNKQKNKANDIKITNKNDDNNSLNYNKLKKNKITGADINNINFFHSGDKGNNNWHYNNDNKSTGINNCHNYKNDNSDLNTTDKKISMIQLKLLIVVCISITHNLKLTIITQTTILSVIKVKLKASKMSKLTDVMGV